MRSRPRIQNQVCQATKQIHRPSHMPLVHPVGHLQMFLYITHGFLHLYLMVLSTQRECAQLCRGGKNFILLLWVSTGAPIAKDRLTREKTSLFHIYHTCNTWEYWEMGNSKKRLRTLGYIVSSTKNNKFVEKWQDKGKWFLAPKGGKLRR